MSFSYFSKLLCSYKLMRFAKISYHLTTEKSRILVTDNTVLKHNNGGTF